MGAANNVSLVTLNRPKALNALNSALMSELRAALRQNDLDSETKCTVLTGSKKAFAAGADIVCVFDLSFGMTLKADWKRV